jgi:homogentisate 1,2-dioxygenase
VERLAQYHRNVDYDEIILVHGGTMFGTEVLLGSLWLNPQGIHHGPPEELRRWYKARWRKDEYSDWQIINVDCEQPLKVTPEAQAAARGGKHR